MNVIELPEDKRLALANLKSATQRIEDAESARYSPDELQELGGMLPLVFEAALPHFVAGRERNPIHHHTQVLDNMVRIGLVECPSYREFRNAVLLALLHDVGNAVSRRPKFKTDEVIAALEEDIHEGTVVALKAIAFRLEHMDHGPALARDVLAPFVSGGKLGDDDVHFIGRAIAVHDYPSIEKVLKELADKTQISTGYEPGDFLLPFESSPFGRLIEWLREADRLFMLTEQGVLKDLRDDDEDATASNILIRLDSNANKHVEEFELYRRVDRAEGFRENTLYRTLTGYNLFIEYPESVRAKWEKHS
ncbi:MAG: hypothetical protein QGH60_02400 [Phycisphaerae bacterium]|jgi:hypothetical protein|nr:hypothetical protein [Phycisphaerae bacterium]